MKLGCTNGACYFRHNTGQVTNGGCNCVRSQATHDGSAWVVPVQMVQIMVSLAARVAVLKERARANALPFGLTEFKCTLVKHHIIHADALEDPDGYDGHATEERLLSAYEDLEASAKQQEVQG